MATAQEDERLRAAVFEWLDDRVAETGNLLSRRELLDAVVADRPMGLIDAGRGIRNPAGLLASLSVVSVPDSPYEDVDDGSGLVRYAFRTGNPDAGDNRKLVEAVHLGVPLVYFVRVQPGVYSAIYPVYAVEVDRNGGGVLLDLTGAGDGVEPLGVPASEQRRCGSTRASSNEPTDQCFCMACRPCTGRPYSSLPRVPTDQTATCSPLGSSASALPGDPR